MTARRNQRQLTMKSAPKPQRIATASGGKKMFKMVNAMR